MSVGSQLALRMGMSAFSGMTGVDVIVGAMGSPWVLAGLAAFALGSISWLVVISRIDLSVAYPLGALNYVVVAALSASVLGEAVPSLRWAGVTFILFGILVIAFGERVQREKEPAAADPSRDGPTRRPDSR